MLNHTGQGDIVVFMLFILWSINSSIFVLRVNFSIPVPRILWWYCSLYLVRLGFAQCWGNPVASRHESVKQDLAASLNVLWYWSVPIFRLKDLYELVAVALCNLHWWCLIKGLFEVTEPVSVTIVSMLFYVRSDSNNNNTLWCLYCTPVIVRRKTCSFNSHSQQHWRKLYCFSARLE